MLSFNLYRMHSLIANTNFIVFVAFRVAFSLSPSYVPIPTYQTQPTKSNLPNIAYQIKLTNSTYHIQHIKHNLPNLTYQTPHTKPKSSLSGV